MTSLAIEKLIHINQLLGDFAGANAFYQDVFSAHEYMNSYHSGEERDASLFVIGDTCIELFSPRTETSLLGRQHRRFGDSWHSFEWKVPDLDEAKAVLDEREVRLGSFYPGGFLMTHPKDTHGLILELCPHEMAHDPRLEPDWSPSPWQSGHPLGIERLNCMSAAVRDLDAAVAFFASLVGTDPIYEVDRPAVGGRGVGLWVTDHILELVGATDADGTIESFMNRYNARMRSIQFHVEDLDRAAEYLESRQLRIVPGDFEGAIAIDPADNFGVLWQFTEQLLPSDPRP
jgi:catechol 2,3-dioxygenase-like lactoylglutathione lyase family enzyme